MRDKDRKTCRVALGRWEKGGMAVWNCCKYVAAAGWWKEGRLLLIISPMGFIKKDKVLVLDPGGVKLRGISR